MGACPCCSQLSYSDCCERLIKGEKTAETPEQLMRSRYTAYAKGEIDYLVETMYPPKRKEFDQRSAEEWSGKSEWKSLEIISVEGGSPEDTEGIVEFIARYSQKNMLQKHHERAEFKKEDDRWYFVDGQFIKPATVRRETPKVGRNDPCPCGSNKKFKKCCGKG